MGFLVNYRSSSSVSVLVCLITVPFRVLPVTGMAGSTETVKTVVSLEIFGVVLGALLIPLLALLGIFLLVASVFMGVTFFVKLTLALVLLPLRIILWIVRAIFRV